MPGENAGEVALIGKAAGRGNLGERGIDVHEKCARVLQPLRNQPLMGVWPVVSRKA